MFRGFSYFLGLFQVIMANPVLVLRSAWMVFQQQIWMESLEKTPVVLKIWWFTKTRTEMVSTRVWYDIYKFEFE